MEDKELDKILKSFHKVKAPKELDRRLSPYLIRKQKKSKKNFYRLSLGIAGLIIVLFVLTFFKRQNSNISFLSEPLYATSLTFGYFTTEISIASGDNVNITLDGESILDTTFTVNDTIYLEIDIPSGFHYIVVDVENIYGFSKYYKVYDIYSL